MTRFHSILCLVLFIIGIVVVENSFAQNDKKPKPPQKQQKKQLNDQSPTLLPTSPRKKSDNKSRKQFAFPLPDAESDVASVIVARPTNTTIDINILPLKNLFAKIEYFPRGNENDTKSTPEFSLQKNIEHVEMLKNLQSSVTYTYRFLYRENENALWQSLGEFSFQMPKQEGQSFSFIVQGDSHPERTQQNEPSFYAKTLSLAAAEKPDFFVALGDDFSVDHLTPETASRDAIDAIYRTQRIYLGIVGHTAPLFLVNGNHEQAALCNLDGTPNNIAVIAQSVREKYFSQPEPNGFYSGNTEPQEHIGLLRNYFAFEWGDALFVVIDPYWHSAQAVDNIFGSRDKAPDPWGATLGKTQYDWLKKTL
ncbi:MAG: metallophosphoesterase, partial [Thermoguttaceae bacterium]